MKKYFFLFVFSLLLSIGIARPIYAVSDPRSVPNNKFGIHVADPNDLPDAATLLNSSGGTWGYVTFVIQDDDKNFNKWQSIMDTMRRLELIPIIRIGTHVTGDSWVIPDDTDIDRWVDFLDKLLWPTKNRYVVLFNEPNHAKEWGYKIDPPGYADIFLKYRKKLKERSEDFFVLPAGLDTAASNDGEAMNAESYIRQMISGHPEMLDMMDGWTSHSYPNPGFSGSVYGSGKGSIRSYSWEISLLKELGLKHDLPIFITETGWMHSEGKYRTATLLSPQEVANRLAIAGTSVWDDKNIVAITPFLLNYQDYPFDHFSFKKLGGGDYYPMYDAYRNIKKTKGRPVQLETARIEGIPEDLLPHKLIVNGTTQVTATIKNTGQSIIDPTKGYRMNVLDTSHSFTVVPGQIPILEPGGTGTINLDIRSPQSPGQYPLELTLTHDDGPTLLKLSGTITVIPPPTIYVTTQFGFKKSDVCMPITVLIYNDREEIIYKSVNPPCKSGTYTVSNLSRVIPDKKYRTVIVSTYYLPRQIILRMVEGGIKAEFSRMLPVDINGDGTFNYKDILAFFMIKPAELFSRIF
jgi:hypothetical protein